jgi:hypothetical protein
MVAYMVENPCGRQAMLRSVVSSRRKSHAAQDPHLGTKLFLELSGLIKLRFFSESKFREIFI